MSEKIEDGGPAFPSFHYEGNPFEPKNGKRHLAGHEFTAFSSTRHWLRAAVSWSITGLPEDIDEKNAFLAAFERNDLGRAK